MAVGKNNIGFLDGYMAGNISSNEVELKSHTDRIKELLKEAWDNIKSIEQGDKSKLQNLNTLVNKVATENIPINASTDDYYQFSLSVEEFITEFLKVIQSKRLTTDANYLLKRSVFHFLNLAKTLQDVRIITIATDTAKQLKDV